MVIRIGLSGVVALFLCSCSPADEADSGVEVRAAAASLDRPIDAAMAPDGTRIYFLQTVADGQGLFAIDGEAPPRQVAAGLDEATSLAVASDGATVVVADATGLTRIRDDGTTSAIAGTTDHAPRGLDLVADAAGDRVIFTGVDPADASPAVFAVPLAGGTIERVATGFAADAELDGVALMADGTAWVTDSRGMVYQASPGEPPATVVADTIVGDPAGLALTHDESTVLVSSVSAAGTSQVLIIDIKSKTTSVFDDVIHANSGSGGVHRARDLDTFAWCGIRGSQDGTVYRIDL